MIHASNHSTLEVEMGGSEVQGEFKASFCLKHTSTQKQKARLELEVG